MVLGGRGGWREHPIFPPHAPIRWLTASDPAVANWDECCAPNLEVKEIGVGEWWGGGGGMASTGGMGEVGSGGERVGY